MNTSHHLLNTNLTIFWKFVQKKAIKRENITILSHTVKTVNINNQEYDLPVNKWHVLNLHNNNKILFYINCTSATSYRGVATAVNKDHSSQLEAFKKIAIETYNRNIGSVVDPPLNINANVNATRNKKKDFI